MAVDSRALSAHARAGFRVSGGELVTERDSPGRAAEVPGGLANVGGCERLEQLQTSAAQVEIFDRLREGGDKFLPRQMNDAMRAWA